MAGSARSKGREMERQCAVTRARLAPEHLLRFAVDPDANVVPDLKQRLPGRGVWLTCSRDILEKAISSRVFDRAFRKPVTAEPDMVERVDGLLERDALQRLSMANKASLVVCGFDKVGDTVRSRQAAALLHASDASSDGCGKLDRLFAAVGTGENGSAKQGPVIGRFNCEQLSLALGRPNVVHAALKFGVPINSFLAAVERLDRFRAGLKAENPAQGPETEEV